jgi:transposase
MTVDGHSLMETCRRKSKASCPVLIELVTAYFKEQQPDLAWIG